MKLSEAIREGSRRWPETRATWTDPNGSCRALGAAAKMVGLKFDLSLTEWHEKLEARFPILTRVLVSPDAWSGCKSSRTITTLWRIISYTHFTGKASREALAEYVESIECQVEEEEREAKRKEIFDGYTRALITAEGGVVRDSSAPADLR